MEMYEIHEKVFDFCFNQRFKQAEALNFSLRKSNRYDRLLHGHWFYGNENYAAVSFWSGSDWKNKTPNIFFGIDKNGWTFLELSASDSDKKYQFFEENLVNAIPDLQPSKNGWRKDYRTFGNDFMGSLKSFLSFEKVHIDTLIRNEAEKYFDEEDNTFNRIGFIEEEDFEKRLRNVLRYRQTFDPKKIRRRIPEHLKSFNLQMNHPKINVSIENLPTNAQWIFFTGLNGTGKTNILRGLLAALLDNFDNNYLINDPTFEAKIEVVKNHSRLRRTVNLTDQSSRPKRKMLKGLAAYGSSRLTVMDFPEGKEVNQEDVIRKSSASYNLFHNDGFLFTIDPIFLNLVENPILKELTKNENTALSRFMNQIVDLLPDIIPNLLRISIPKVNAAIDVWTLIEFIEEDEYGEKLPAVPFENLSSGAKSMVAMFGDMLIRLYSQQPEVEDFSELTGIVIIDEIDVHLHPKIQRLLVETLTGIFPRIQFIATTHSPIPMLGAPNHSVFFRVERRAKEGIQAVRLKQLELEIEHLLPNTLYTSDLFNLENIVSIQNTDVKSVDTSNNYDEYQIDAKLAKQIKRIKSNSDDDFLKFLRNEKN